MTNVGTIRGERQKLFSSRRPMKLPRTSANAAGTPTRMASTVVLIATTTLTLSASKYSGEIARYQRNVNPCGGKDSTGEAEKDDTTVVTIGSSRNARTTVTLARRAKSLTLTLPPAAVPERKKRQSKCSKQEDHRSC